MNVTLSRQESLGGTIFSWLTIFGFVFASGVAMAQGTDATDSEESEETVEEAASDEESEDSEEVAASEDDEEATETDSSMEEITVTGSRLPQGDPAALVHTYTAEQIEATGATNMEEFFRTLPWQYSSRTSQSAHIWTGDSLGWDSGGPVGTIDLATVNLRSLGSGNTLVLLNGKRVAGFAGSETDVVNILGIPLESIERVEVQLDGGSAVYGSDAIAGVVNFITKKNYRGLTANYRQETSSSGAGNMSGSLTGGLNWNGGNATVTVSMRESEPIINSKTGWNSRDYREMLGPEFDYRIRTYSQPGIVREYNGNARYPGYDWWDPAQYQLPADHSGVGATVEDFVTDVADFVPYDRIPIENGSHTDQQSISLSVKHDVFRWLELDFSALITQYSSFRRNALSFFGIAVPASNAFNPFGRTMYVQYIPDREFELGLMPTPYTAADGTQSNLSGGFMWHWGSEQRVSFDFTKSESDRTYTNWRINTRRGKWDPTHVEFYNALKSSDPNTAMNLFGNGTVQGASFADLLTNSYEQNGGTVTESMALVASGRLFTIWGGDITYSLGATRNKVTIRNESQYAYSWEEPTTFDGYSSYIGVEQPTTRSAAYFFEFAVPLIGPNNAGWWGKSLYMTIQNRYDVNWTWGSAGNTGETRVPYSEWPTKTISVWDPDVGDYVDVDVPDYPGVTYEANIVKAEQSRQSPRIGILYRPIEDVQLRLSWSRAFQLPLPSQLFDTWSDAEWTTSFFDPYFPTGPQQVEDLPVVLSWYNIDLEPEFSDNKSISFQWDPSQLEGFRLKVDWSSVNFQNRVMFSSTFLYQYPEIAAGVPDIIERDEDGFPTQLNYKLINVAANYHINLDVAASYRFGIGGLGTFEPELRYSRILDDYLKIIPGTPNLSELGTQNTADRYQTHLSLFWDRNNMRGNLYVRYRPGYLNPNAHWCQSWQVGIGRCVAAWEYISLNVGSLTTVDGTFSYTFENSMQLQFGGRNLLNRDAPNTIRGGLPYDPVRYDARGRVLSLSLRYTLD